jgi:uncharacterized protein (TIGR02145 family)
MENVKDIDGNSYKTVIIGEQIWMAENLKVTHYRNGDSIITGLASRLDGKFAKTFDKPPPISSNYLINHEGAYVVYNDDPSNVDIYGNLYNWYAVDDERGVCPEGWHVPTIYEWEELVDYLGGSDIAGGLLKDTGTKERGTGLWQHSNSEVTNASGFTALPCGLWHLNGKCQDMGDRVWFWSSTECNRNLDGSIRSQSDFLTPFANMVLLNSVQLKIQFIHYFKDMGFSVRCIRD